MLAYAVPFGVLTRQGQVQETRQGHVQSEREGEGCPHLA